MIRYAPVKLPCELIVHLYRPHQDLSNAASVTVVSVLPVGVLPSLPCEAIGGLSSTAGGDKANSGSSSTESSSLPLETNGFAAETLDLNALLSCRLILALGLLMRLDANDDDDVGE
jgi:hypothetical protein